MTFGRLTNTMLQAPPRDAFPVLDWIMSRHVHEYLDVAGRPVGEGRAAAFQDVQTEMQPCPYAGRRYHHAKPMNVSALRQIMPAWEQIKRMLSWLSERYRTRHQTEITSYDDLSLVTSAGVFLADFVVLRQHRPLLSGEIPVLISGLYKVCLGFQLATFLGSMRDRFAGETTPKHLPDAAGFYDDLEARELLIGEAEVCSGSAAMIMEAYDAMTGRRAVATEALPPECTHLGIAWEQHDVFADHAAHMWDDLVMYVIEASRYCPELADPRLPPEVQDRLNACLEERGTQLLAGQTGLVVDLVRGAQDDLGPRDALRPTVTPVGAVSSPSLQPGSLAATVLRWLNDVAVADMSTYAPVVASTLSARLAPYDHYEATVLDGLNHHLGCLMDALGLGRPNGPLTASALSHVCGRTLRDWGNTSW
jgi:hypothetical protein